MKTIIILLQVLFIISDAIAQDTDRNVISTSPFSPLFSNVQLAYQRQAGSMLEVGAQGRYYYAPPIGAEDSLRSNGGDLTLFAKIKSGKEPGGFYVLTGLMAGYYHTMAGYGHKEPSYWFGGNYDMITTVEHREFFTCGAKLMFGYEVLINRLSLDFSFGIKGLILPASVTDPVENQKLLDVWGNSRWSAPVSPGSIFQLGIMTGYRF